ncbi:MAG: hypothetical protein AMJ53_05075 [Gammaproteobacteria bacterium SG8_11]|nr:MAG: hypothetical protein AMJ53_05075 [Gammaproteobacteria bacterium SG8_11]
MLGGFFYGFLSGCSQIPLQSQSLQEHPPEIFQKPVELTHVAFNPQNQYQCGPAALATILQQNDIAVQVSELVPQVYLPDRKGSLQVELIAVTRKYGLIPYVLDKKLSSLIEELRAGHPVLVMQNLGLDWFPQWHYAVVIGYNLHDGELILRSGTIKRHINSFELFERTWRRAQYWALVAVPPGTLPSSATPLSYLKSVAPFEELGKHDIAQQAYKTGLSRWPEDRPLRMALGNVSFSLGEYSIAIESYKQVIQRSPDYAPAQNNLALTLMELQQFEEAEKYAREAIQSGGRFKEQYENTLKTIYQRKLESSP